MARGLVFLIPKITFPASPDGDISGPWSARHGRNRPSVCNMVTTPLRGAGASPIVQANRWVHGRRLAGRLALLAGTIRRQDGFEMDSHLANLDGHVELGDSHLEPSQSLWDGQIPRPLWASS